MAVNNLLEIENLINTYNLKLGTISTELKQLKNMFSDMIENDEEYALASENAKKSNKEKSLAKAKFLKRPEANDLQDKIKFNQSQLKEIKLALSDYLTQYMRESGTNQVPAPDGTFFRIIYSAKLVKGE
jgi:hypothetical protein